MSSKRRILATYMLLISVSCVLMFMFAVTVIMRMAATAVLVEIGRASCRERV